MNKMESDYEHILNLQYDEAYKIPLTKSDTMIINSGRDNEKLDGLWNFTIDMCDTGLRKKFFEEVRIDDRGRDLPVDFSFDSWEEINVPSNWNNVKPEYLYYEGSAWYTRKFKYYKKSNEERVFLYIGAASYECRVWFNKKLIARHIGGNTPFNVEVTDYLKEDNRILIMVNNTRKLEAIPSLNFDWFNYGGLYRSVELIRVNKSFIKDFFISLVPGSEYGRIRAEVKVEGVGSSSCILEIPELKINKEIPIDSNGYGYLEFNAKPELWSPENPYLYEVQLVYTNDKVRDTVGFREIKVEDNKILLNGKEVFLKGVCAHEDSVVNGKSLTEEEMLETIQCCKDMNCNFIRLAHYPHSEKMSKLADKLGIMLWEEIPVYWALDFDNIDTIKNAENQLKELIIRDRNRASVIIWSVGNENPDTDSRLNFMKNLASICRKLDGTRLVSCACLVNIDEFKIIDRMVEYIDVVSINEYYGWYYRDFDRLNEILKNSILGKPLIISETGAEAIDKHFGTCDEIYTENCQAEIYKRQFEILDKYDKVKGICPWILFDYRTPVRINSYQKGYNLKGLMSRDKKYKKLAFNVVKTYYSNK